MSTALPIKVDISTLKIYFDCKVRRLFIHACKKAEEPKPAELLATKTEAEAPEAPAAATPTKESTKEQNVQDEPTTDLTDDIIEIDTDEHFGRKNTGKKQSKTAAPPKIVEIKEEADPPNDDDDDDMLYDLM